MVQVLCYTGKRFDTCWRPVFIAYNPVEFAGADYGDEEHLAPYTPIRFHR